MARPADQSGIIRTRRDRNNPYAMVNKAAFEDERLSWEARGVLAYLLTKPDDWQVRTSDLLNRAPKCGGDKLARILKELEDAGYLVRERKAGAHGRFEWVTTVYENPLDAAEVREKTGKRRSQSTQPLPENPVMDKPHQEAKSTITGFAINGSAINGKPAHIVNTESSNLSSTYVEERGPRAKRAATHPKEKKDTTPIAVIQALADVCVIDRSIATKKDHIILADAAGALYQAGKRQEQTDEQIIEAISGFGKWFKTSDFRGQKGEAPTPDLVRRLWKQYIEARRANNRPVATPQPRQQHAPTDVAKLAELRAKRNGTS